MVSIMTDSFYAIHFRNKPVYLCSELSAIRLKFQDTLGKFLYLFLNFVVDECIILDLSFHVTYSFYAMRAIMLATLSKEKMAAFLR